MNRNLLLAFTKERPKMEMAHDEWAYLVANLCGHMFLDKESRILYRQHSGNQVGIRRSFLQIWKRRLRTLGKSLKTHPKETAAKEMIRIHGNLMTHEAMEAAIKLATYRGSISSMLNCCEIKITHLTGATVILAKIKNFVRHPIIFLIAITKH